MKDLSVEVEEVQKFPEINVSFTITSKAELINLWHRFNLNNFRTGYGATHRYTEESLVGYISASAAIFEELDNCITNLKLKKEIYK